MKQRVKSGVNSLLKREQKKKKKEIFRELYEYGTYPTENAPMESKTETSKP